jgi:glycosyltransferase involved in cell wall biosynthesis
VYPFECEKWKKICHHCEHLDKPIKINRDASTRNQSIKSKIYRDSRLFVASPSEWLTDMAKKSILKNRFTEFRTISNGVDEKLFKVNPKLHNKEKINISKNNFVALFIGSGASKNKAKGLSNLISVIKDLSRRQINIKITFLVLGDNFKTKRFGNDITLKSGGWMHDKNEIVKYYNASDLYIHLANAENFPTTILEAMHCGLPVIGSNIGGIPEQIVHGKTGFLFENHQTSEIANKIIQLIRNPKLRKDIGSNGKERAVKEFTQNKMAKNYLDWFEEILSERKTISREC